MQKCADKRQSNESCFAITMKVCICYHWLQRRLSHRACTAWLIRFSLSIKPHACVLQAIKVKTSQNWINRQRERNGNPPDARSLLTLIFKCQCDDVFMMNVCRIRPTTSRYAVSNYSGRLKSTRHTSHVHEILFLPFNGRRRPRNMNRAKNFYRLGVFLNCSLTLHHEMIFLDRFSSSGEFSNLKLPDYFYWLNSASMKPKKCCRFKLNKAIAQKKRF